MEIGELVLCERFGGKKIKSARIWVGEKFRNDWEIVRKRFAGGGAGAEDDVLILLSRPPCFELVRVEGVNPTGDQGLGEWGRQTRRKGKRLGGARRESPPGDEVGGGV